MRPETVTLAIVWLEPSWKVARLSRKPMSYRPTSTNSEVPLPDGAAKIRQYQGVDPIRLGQLTRGLGIVPDLTGVDHHHRQPRYHQASSQIDLQAARGLQDDELRLGLAQPVHHFDDAHLVVGKADALPRRDETLCPGCPWKHQCQQTLQYSRSYPALQKCGLTGPSNRSGYLETRCGAQRSPTGSRSQGLDERATAPNRWIAVESVDRSPTATRGHGDEKRRGSPPQPHCSQAPPLIILSLQAIKATYKGRGGGKGVAPGTRLGQRAYV